MYSKHSLWIQKYVMHVILLLALWLQENSFNKETPSSIFFGSSPSLFTIRTFFNIYFLRKTNQKIGLTCLFLISKKGPNFWREKILIVSNCGLSFSFKMQFLEYLGVKTPRIFTAALLVRVLYMKWLSKCTYSNKPSLL